MMKQTQRQFTKRWSQARDEAFDAGRQYMPTNFAPKDSQWHRPHGNA